MRTLLPDLSRPPARICRSDVGGGLKSQPKVTAERKDAAVGDRIEELTALEHRLVLERTSSLTTMAKQTPGLPFDPVELSRVADIDTVLQAVRSELSARLPSEGWSAGEER